MTSEELRLKLILLGFVQNKKVQFGTSIDAYTLSEEGNEFTVYYSHYSNNWFTVIQKDKGNRHFNVPSKKLTADSMHNYIMKKLGI